LQALTRIEWHLTRASRAIQRAWKNLIGLGAGRLKRANTSLQCGPLDQRALVKRFFALVK